MKQDINPKYRKFIDLLDFSNGKYDIKEVFNDFVIIYAIAIKNKFYYEQEDEDIYFSTIKKYEKDELDIFPELIVELQEIYMKEREIRDVLGEIYFQIGSIKKGNKQFFSPKSIGIINSILVQVYMVKEEKDFNTIYDPTCGSGTLLLYSAKTLIDNNIDYTKKAFYWGQDNDFVCFCMAYIQMSVYGMPALVILGDTISLQEKKVYYTPEFFIGGWKKKLEERRKNNNIKDKERFDKNG